VRRSYSIAGIGDTWIDLLLMHRWELVLNILGSKVGDGVEMIGFLGSFVVENESYEDKSVLFVATGTGIAPFYPMIEEMLKKSYKGKISLWWGMRYEKDLYWWEKLEEIKTKNNNFDYEIVLSKGDEKWQGRKDTWEI
jgi:NAD(P)H-flavin reductase